MFFVKINVMQNMLKNACSWKKNWLKNSKECNFTKKKTYNIHLLLTPWLYIIFTHKTTKCKFSRKNGNIQGYNHYTIVFNKNCLCS